MLTYFLFYAFLEDYPFFHIDVFKEQQFQVSKHVYDIKIIFLLGKEVWYMLRLRSFMLFAEFEVYLLYCFMFNLLLSIKVTYQLIQFVLISFFFLFYHFILFMELTKINLLNFQVISSPIQRNFQLIEKQFVAIHQTLSQLKAQNVSISADLTKYLNYTKNLSQSKNQQMHSIGDFLVEYQNSSIAQIKKTNSQTMNFQNKLMKNCNERNSNIHQADNMAEISSENQFSSQILKQITNTQQSLIKNAGKSLQKRHQQLIRSKTKKLSIFNINNQKIQQKHKGKDDLTFIQNKLRIFQANLLEQISQLNKQIMQFQQTQSVFKTKFEILQKQNETFKKLLGIKKKNVTLKKQTDKPEEDFHKSKKVLQSKSKISLKTINQNGIQTEKNSKKKITFSQNNSSNEEDIQENGILSLNTEIQKIRDYLNGKMKAIDQNFSLVNINIQNIERNMQILERTDNDMKSDIQALQQTCNQTKLNIGQINQKTMIKSRFRSNDILKDQNSKNREAGQQSLQIQDRIIELLDQMEKIKSQYSALFSRKEGDNNQNQLITQEILEKRKKLALKLNPNSQVDQKTKKQLNNVKRDLRKLKEQFDLLMNGVNTGSHQTKTLIIKPNETKEDWKSLTTKIYKTRQQLLSIVKDLQAKIIANNDLTVVLNEMEVEIGECKILLKKKVDIVEFQKTTKRIQSRLNNFIKQTFEKEGYTNEQDAMITKQPWFCLSCDIQLKTYTGKLNRGQGNQSPNQKPMGKKVNPQSHMVRRNQNGRLPSLAL